MIRPRNATDSKIPLSPGQQPLQEAHGRRRRRRQRDQQQPQAAVSVGDAEPAVLRVDGCGAPQELLAARNELAGNAEPQRTALRLLEGIIATCVDVDGGRPFQSGFHVLTNSPYIPSPRGRRPRTARSGACCRTPTCGTSTRATRWPIPRR